MNVPVFWAIRNTRDPALFWSNEWGWGDGNISMFSDLERSQSRLPIDGYWVRVGGDSVADALAMAMRDAADDVTLPQALEIAHEWCDDQENWDAQIGPILDRLLEIHSDTKGRER